jgi:hypothetical protein
MIRIAARYVMLAAAMALATRALGWWAPTAVAIAWAMLSARAMRAPWDAALAALLGWGALLLWTAAEGPLGELAHRLAGILDAPPAALVGATLLFGALLAWSAGTIAAVLRPTASRG